MTDRANTIKEIIQRVTRLDEEALAKVLSFIEISEHHGKVIIEAPIESNDLTPEEKELFDFHDLIDQNDLDALVKRLDKIKAQGSEQVYQEALKRNFSAAVCFGTNLNFAHWLVQKRGFHDTEYFRTLLEKDDFETAAILAPNMTTQELETILRSVQELPDDENLDNLGSQELFLTDLLEKRQRIVV